MSPTLNMILLKGISEKFIISESLKTEFGTKTGAWSNLLIRVDLKSIFSTEPSATPSTLIQSPCLNLFSPIINNPPIKFLNKFCAPKANATENKPKPAMIDAASIPHSSNTLTMPIKYNTNFIALKIHALKVGDRKSYFSPTKSLRGSILPANDQNIAK